MKPQIRKSKHARTISHQQVESVVAAAVVVIVVVVVNGRGTKRSIEAAWKRKKK